MSDELDLARFRAALSGFAVKIGARRIRDGDEAAFGDPSRPATAANLASRRASGAARIVARELLGEWGSDLAAPLDRLPSRAPRWPEGALGSLAHDEEFAIAAVARVGALVGLGVDIEPAEPLPPDILDFALSEAERRSIGGDPLRARLIFAAKEAVYKAVNPFDGSALEYDDIEVRLAEGLATLRDGRSLQIVTDAGDRLLAAALLGASAPRSRNCPETLRE